MSKKQRTRHQTIYTARGEYWEFVWSDRWKLLLTLAKYVRDPRLNFDSFDFCGVLAAIQMDEERRNKT